MTRPTIRLPRPRRGERPPTRGYVEPAELAGRTAGEVAVWVVLALTAGADVTAFYQLLAVYVLRALPGPLVVIGVLGFTACSLLLAHFAGRLARDVRADEGESSLLRIVAGAWVAIGVIPCAVRLVVASGQSDVAIGSVISPAAETRSGAAVFFALYVGSGLVAGIGAFRTHNPLRDRHRAAVRAHHSALRRLHRTRAPYERAITVLQVHINNLHREFGNHDAAKRLRLAFATEMKAYGQLLVAGHLQNPSATTGITTHRTATPTGHDEADS